MEKIETARLCLTLASNEEMERIITAETDAELKKAYGDMLQGSQEHPEIRELYDMWLVKLKEAPGTVIGDMCFKGLADDGMVEIGYGMEVAKRMIFLPDTSYQSLCPNGSIFSNV